MSGWEILVVVMRCRRWLVIPEDASMSTHMTVDSDLSTSLLGPSPNYVIGPSETRAVFLSL